VIGSPFRLRLIRKDTALVRIFPTLDLSKKQKPHGGSGTGHWGLFPQVELLKLQENGQFPDETVRIKV
jgi:hypothetical protein